MRSEDPLSLVLPFVYQFLCKKIPKLDLVIPKTDKTAFVIDNIGWRQIFPEMFPSLHSPAVNAKEIQMWFNKPRFFSYDELDIDEQEFKNRMANIRDLSNTRDLLSSLIKL